MAVGSGLPGATGSRGDETTKLKRKNRLPIFKVGIVQSNFVVWSPRKKTSQLTITVTIGQWQMTKEITFFKVTNTVTSLFRSHLFDDEPIILIYTSTVGFEKSRGGGRKDSGIKHVGLLLLEKTQQQYKYIKYSQLELFIRRTGTLRKNVSSYRHT